MTITVALAGNPNVGKSTIFNALTGSRQHTGNWPGKTVEKKEGRLRVGDNEVLLVDLPGTYSLTAYSVEEIIARDFIVNDQPSAVIAVIDASNLERNLYLVAQLIELERPVIIALNMTDIAESRGLHIDADRLSQQLGGLPVVEMVGNRSLGLDELKRAIAVVSERPPEVRFHPRYTGEIAEELTTLEQVISADEAVARSVSPRWLATKLLEEDPAIVDALQERGATYLLDAAAASQARIEEATGEDAETLIADQRYEFIGQIIDAVVDRPSHAVQTVSDRIDAIVTHRIWGLPIFLLMMWVVFQFTASVSAPFLDWVDVFINETVYGWAGALLASLGLGSSWIASLVTDGIIAGVGGVLVFVPVLMFLYIALGVLEDSGYMARAAFVMDRVMRWLGLHGKSFLPMIVGFGCTVPAVYATRTLEHEKDRKLTALLATFMSCGARLPVYVVFGAAFFGAASGNLIFAMYLVGIGVALATGFAMKHTVYRGQPPAPFVMELPPYRIPHPSDVGRQMWERTRSFVIKASSVILGVSIVLWFLMAIPAQSGVGSFNDVAPENSLFGTVSGAVSPVFAPAGFGTWEATGSLVTGVMAKEVIVGTMNQIYVGEEEAAPPAVAEASFFTDVRETLVGFGQATLLTIQEMINIIPRTINLLPFVELPYLNLFGEAVEEASSTRLQVALVNTFTQSAGSAAAGMVAAVAFNVFVLLYVPCMTTVAAMRHEFGSRWMWVQIIYTLLIAWIAAVMVFQVGRMLV